MVRIQFFSDGMIFFICVNKRNYRSNNNKNFKIKKSLKINRFKNLDKLILFRQELNLSSTELKTTFYIDNFLVNSLYHTVLNDVLQSISLACKLFSFWICALLSIIPVGFCHWLSNLFCLDLIFLRRRFFPQITDNFSGHTIINGSLGFISKFFSKKKNFLRSKASYLLLSGFFRRVIVNIKFFRLRLKIRGLPVFIGSILNCLLSKTNSLYKSPFDRNFIVNEKEFNNSNFFNFISIHFMQNKFYGTKKFKKCGRLKRKIRKKVVLNNNILD